MQYTDSSGSQKQFRGHPRHDVRRARADLEVIRAAASKLVHTINFEATANEAQRLQKYAAFEVEVAIAIGNEMIRPQARPDELRDRVLP